MRTLSLQQVLVIHERVIAQSGGSRGVRDWGALEAAIAQPRMTFGGEELYPTVAAKAAALGHSLIMNHPFVDGNKRAGHGALEVFLVLNGYELAASVDEQEAMILDVAAGEIDRASFIEWVEENVVPLRAQ